MPLARKAKLTKKQAAVLEFIRRFMAEHDYAPSYREIATGVGLSSPATVYEHIQALKEKGFLKAGSGIARDVELTPKAGFFTKAVSLPLVGFIAAGKPIEAIAENEQIAVPLELLEHLNCYVLQVKGDSMIEDGILDGDYVIVERAYYPQNGDLVVALLDNENVTLKRYYREKNCIRLEPANRNMKPIYVKNPTIQGIVRAVMRKY
jgi:repressor LexA